MDPVQTQYETYPYPERDPADEARRLIVGSPSDLPEVDHMLFGGQRDWRQPFRALFAGGGTGDGLIQLAQKLASIRCPAEVVYLDMSEASRRVAEARAAARGLTNIRFLTGDLLSAPEHGPFDYIDCTGVLHHLPDPQAGFTALAAAMTDEGGMGGMVYAPYGRTGVYPLQDALHALTDGQTPGDQIKTARAVLKSLPRTNWFGQNQFLSDHKISDAGLYDLLLHSRDRPYTVGQLNETLVNAGLQLISFAEPATYDPKLYLAETLWPQLETLSPAALAALAEQLAGNMKAHVFYAARTARTPAAPGPEARPCLNGVAARALGGEITRRGMLKIDVGGHKVSRAIPNKAGALVALCDGRLTLGEVAKAGGMDWLMFSRTFAPAHDVLTGHNLLRYSAGAR